VAINALKVGRTVAGIATDLRHSLRTEKGVIVADIAGVVLGRVAGVSATVGSELGAD